MAPPAEQRSPCSPGEEPIPDAIVVAPWSHSDGSESSENIYNPRREPVNYPAFLVPGEPSRHPTPANGPNLAFAVADTAIRTAPEPVAATSNKQVEPPTQHQGRSKSRRKAQDPDGPVDSHVKGKRRANTASEEQPPRKKAKLEYCEECTERKSKPAVTGRTQRNGNATHKCPKCKELREKASQQAERPSSEGKASEPAQPEREDVLTAGKGQPQPPKPKNGAVTNPIPGKLMFVARPWEKAHQEQGDDSALDTESDRSDNRPLPNRQTPNVDRFGATQRPMGMNHQIPGGLRQQDPGPGPISAVPGADLHDNQGRRSMLSGSPSASAQQDWSAYFQPGPSFTSPPASVSPAWLDSRHFSDLPWANPSHPELPGLLKGGMEELLSSKNVGASMTPPANHANLADPQAVAAQAPAAAPANPHGINAGPVPVDPALLAAHGQVGADAAHQPGLNPTSTYQWTPTGQEHAAAAANPQPASSSLGSAAARTQATWPPAHNMGAGAASPPHPGHLSLPPDSRARGAHSGAQDTPRSSSYQVSQDDGLLEEFLNPDKLS